MWKRSFVATTVALGDSVDDALASLGGAEALGASAAELVAALRSPQRATRAGALAKAVRDVVVAIDAGTLR